MNRKGTLIGLVALAMVCGAYFTLAAPGGQADHGIVKVLNSILSELQVISDQLAGGGGGGCCGNGPIANPRLADGLVAPPALGVNPIVSITGPGRFLSARLSKQGGTSGLTEVRLVIDGNDVVRRNIVALKNLGLTTGNPYGIVVLSSPDLDTVTIGFTEPLAFQSNLTLSANVNEGGVVQITGAVVYGN